MSSSNCCFLTCIQISQEANQVVLYSHFLKNFPQFIVIHTVKGFGIVNKAKVDVCLEFSCFFYDPTDVGNLISGSSAFSKSSLYIWKFSVHILLKTSLKDFEHYLASMWNECSCGVVYTFFGIGMKTDLSRSCGQCCFPDLLAYWVQHKLNGVWISAFHSLILGPDPTSQHSSSSPWCDFFRLIFIGV